MIGPITLPVQIREVTHLVLDRIEIRPTTITAVFFSGRIETIELPSEQEGGEPGSVTRFVRDPDIQQPTTRKVMDRPAFEEWLLSRGAVTSPTYGVLFTQRDVMEFIGMEEYARRGIEVPGA